jgi:hypothetical protein
VALNTQRKEGELDTLTNRRIIHVRYIDYVSDLTVVTLKKDRFKTYACGNSNEEMIGNIVN